MFRGAWGAGAKQCGTVGEVTKHPRTSVSFAIVHRRRSLHCSALIAPSTPQEPAGGRLASLGCFLFSYPLLFWVLFSDSSYRHLPQVVGRGAARAPGYGMLAGQIWDISDRTASLVCICTSHRRSEPRSRHPFHPLPRSSGPIYVRPLPKPEAKLTGRTGTEDNLSPPAPILLLPSPLARLTLPSPSPQPFVLLAISLARPLAHPLTHPLASPAVFLVLQSTAWWRRRAKAPSARCSRRNA